MPTSASPERSGAPLFVIGNRRSGTTLLRLMLTAHPRIGIPPEGGFTVQLGWRYGNRSFRDPKVRKQFTEDLANTENAPDWKLDMDNIGSALRRADPSTFSDAAEAIYMDYLARLLPGKARWGDKTTWFLDFIADLDEHFPSCVIVHLLRDGRDVACSYREVPHLTNNIGRVALEWATNVETIWRASRRIGPSRFYQLKYESLVSEPESELRKLCGFLEEDFDERMLDFWCINADQELEPSRHMGWKARTIEPVGIDTVGRWRRGLNEREINKFEAIAGTILEAAGYDLGGRRRDFGRVLGTGRRFAYAAKWRVRSRLRKLKGSVAGGRRGGR